MLLRTYISIAWGAFATLFSCLPFLLILHLQNGKNVYAEDLQFIIK